MKILIDGVDVSSCPYFYDYKDLTHLCQNGLDNLYCKENANCYYKQIQRLKAENEELKAFKKACFKPILLPGIDEPEVINKYKQALEEVIELTRFTDEFHNFACKKNCENYREPKEYHLLCRLIRISEKIDEVLRNEIHN